MMRPMLTASILVLFGFVNLSFAQGETVLGQKASAISFAVTNPDYAATALSNGTAVSFNMPAVQSPTLFMNAYNITVPSGASRIVFQLTTQTPNADVDLFVRFNQDVAISGGSAVADYKAETTSGNETITVNSPQAGVYYIAFGLFTPNVQVSATIVATYTTSTTPPPGGSISGGSLILPQFVNGGGWNTFLFLTNPSTSPENFTLNFYGSGALRRAPILGFGSVDTINGSLSPGQTLVYETTTTTQLETGWAVVTPATTTANRITGFAVFRFRTGSLEVEAIVSFGSTADRTLTLLYDQQNGFLTGMALVNPSPNSTTFSIAIRDQNGGNLGSDSITLAGYGQQAFFASERFPATINRRGSLLITAPNGFSLLGLRFSPLGPFTSFPPLR